MGRILTIILGYLREHHLGSSAVYLFVCQHDIFFLNFSSVNLARMYNILRI